MTLTRAVLLLQSFIAMLLAAPSGAAAQPEWPFQPYSHARAYTYNFFASDAAGNPGWYSGKKGRIWSATSGWSPYIRSTTMLNDADAHAVARIVHATRGAFETSKCPFMPRHAVVYFNNKDEPVAGVEVCFECGDVAVWPNYPENRRLKLDWEKLETIYNAALRCYGAIFSAKLNLPLNWKDDPQPPPAR